MQGMRISPEELAPVIGMSPNAIRYRMKNGTLPIGSAVKVGDTRGKRRYRYDIFIPKVLEYTGLKEWPKT